MPDARLLDDAAKAANLAELLTAASAANTAAATSGAGQWIDTRPFEGDILVIQALGALTGSIVGKLQAASDANGTGAADISGAAFTSATAHGIQAIAVDKNSMPSGLPFLGFVGTITTGPAIVGAVAIGRLKYN
jgi:hypothetical protein